MTKSDIYKIISSAIKEEMSGGLDDITSDISSSTPIGKHWVKLIHELEMLMLEINDFKDANPTLSPKLNTNLIDQQLEIILKSLGQIKPVILGMDDIQSSY